MILRGRGVGTANRGSAYEILDLCDRQLHISSCGH